MLPYIHISCYHRVDNIEIFSDTQHQCQYLLRISQPMLSTKEMITLKCFHTQMSCYHRVDNIEMFSDTQHQCQYLIRISQLMLSTKEMITLKCFHTRMSCYHRVDNIEMFQILSTNASIFFE